MAITDWTVVVPVKGSAAAKSRFGGAEAFRRELARAMALDTVEAALAASRVGGVVVVTSAPFAADFVALGATVVPDPGLGLIAAIESGLGHVPDGGGSAVLLGDLPAMTAGELGAALDAALAQPLSVVADADREGTVLSAATAGHAHSLAFGGSSRAAHVSVGYVELVGDWPGLRRDVDIAEHLDGLTTVGPRTTLVLGR